MFRLFVKFKWIKRLRNTCLHQTAVHFSASLMPNWLLGHIEHAQAAIYSIVLGTIHRFPHQWLLISLIYPPKPPAENPNQAGLF
jgi:hypothetical protein